jgi:NADPH:quinone reductase-like Zn-dependent oxidoreductase
MRSVVHDRYGPPLESVRIAEVPNPVPGDDQLLLKVRAAAVNPLDLFVRGKPYFFRVMFGMRAPKDTRLGRDVAGEVESVGAHVTKFKAGDPVFGVCAGAFAEYACAGESKVIKKPEKMSFEQAASVPIAALSALQGLRDHGKLQAGQKVLINGAAGGVGTFAVQIAKAFGAEVTGVCSTANVMMVRSIGADDVIDYTKQDFMQGGRRYDLVLDCIGNRPLFALRHLLTPGGKCVMLGAPKGGWFFGPVGRILSTILLSKVMSERFAFFLARITTDDLAAIRELILAGKVRPVIDRTYPLSDAPAAIAYMEEGHARGKVVVTVA